MTFRLVEYKFIHVTSDRPHWMSSSAPWWNYISNTVLWSPRQCSTVLPPPREMSSWDLRYRKPPLGNCQSSTVFPFLMPRPVVQDIFSQRCVTSMISLSRFFQNPHWDQSKDLFSRAALYTNQSRNISLL